MMTKTPAMRLRQLRIQNNFATATDAARHHGWHITTYRSHENGNRGIPIEAARRYAKAYGVHPNELLGLATPVTSIIADAAAGVWHAKNAAEHKRNVILSLPLFSSETGVQRLVRVSDESANLIIRQGEFAIVGAFDEVEGGKYYLIERRRGDLVETSIRAAVKNGDGSFKLVAPSTHESYSDDVTYPSEGDDVVVILGRVIGRYTEFE